MLGLHNERITFVYKEHNFITKNTGHVSYKESRMGEGGIRVRLGLRLCGGLEIGLALRINLEIPYNVSSAKNSS